ncbi:MAG: tetrahydrofolate dehydrogenase/cyclohydrolase catalytic domain-containing protein, partial [Myxococcota bacterium]
MTAGLYAWDILSESRGEGRQHTAQPTRQDCDLDRRKPPSEDDGPMSDTLIIDGKALTQKVRDEIKQDVEAITSTGRPAPHLVVVLASDDPASAVYVRNKGRAADQVGIRSTQHTLPVDTSADELLALVDRLNADPDVD